MFIFNKKAFSYIEIIIVFVIIAVLSTIGYVSFAGVKTTSTANSVDLYLERSIAASNGLVSASGTGFIPNMASVIQSTGLTYTSGFSQSATTVSVAVAPMGSSGVYNQVVFAILNTASNYCMIAVSNLGNVPTWGIGSVASPNTCSAGNALLQISNITSIVQSSPSSVPL